MIGPNTAYRALYRLVQAIVGAAVAIALFEAFYFIGYITGNRPTFLQQAIINIIATMVAGIIIYAAIAGRKKPLIV